MKFAKATKKISAIAASAVLASSAAFAASNYPANFENSGVTVVVGSMAAPSDMTAAEAIVSDIEAANAGEASNVVITYTSSSSGGESAPVRDSGSVVKLGSDLGTVKSTVFDDRDLDILADGTLRVGSSNNDYSQEIDVLAGTFEHSFRDRLEDSMSQKIFLDRNTNLMSYTVRFDDVIADIDFVNAELQGEEIELLGNTYTIAEADWNTGNPSMKLLGGSNKLALGEGQSTSVSVDGTTYDITVNNVDTTANAALLEINGQSVTIDKFDSERVGGVNIVLTNLVGATGRDVVGYAEIVVGGSEIVLDDGNEVELNDEVISKTIQDYYVEVNFDTTSGNSVDGMTFTYQWKGTDGIILRAGESYDDQLFNAFGLRFDGTNDVEYTETVLTAGRDSLTLETELIDGTVLNRDIAFAEEYDTSATETSAGLRLVGDNRDMPMLIDPNVDFSANTSTITQIPQFGAPTNLEAIYRVEDDNANVIFIGEGTDVDRLFDLATAVADNTVVRGFLADFADGGLQFLAERDEDVQYLYTYSGFRRDSVSISDDEYTILDQDDRGASNQRYVEADSVSSASVTGRLPEVTAFTSTRNGDGETVIQTITFNDASGTLSLEGEGILNIANLFSDDLVGAPANVVFSYDATDLTLDATNDDGTFEFTVTWDASDDVMEITFNDGGSTANIVPVTGRAYVSDSNRDLFQRVDEFGTIVEYDNDARDVVTIMVPDRQLEAEVSLVVGGGSSTMTRTVSEDAVESVRAELIADGYTIVGTQSASSTPMDVDVTGPVMDTDVASNENLIVVGGPAVNMVAREMLGIMGEYNYETDAGVNPGQGIARYFEEENSILVYGYSAADTMAVVERLNAGTVNFQ